MKQQNEKIKPFSLLRLLRKRKSVTNLDHKHPTMPTRYSELATQDDLSAAKSSIITWVMIICALNTIILLGALLVTIKLVTTKQ